jgi:beta-lactam-binding protein with PASTA domain
VKFKDILWTIPFICFISGYTLLYIFFQYDEIYTPSVVGKSLEEALEILSKQNLNARLLAQKEDPNLPAGIIISQIPHAGEKIKPYQALLFVVSKKVSLQAPQCINKLVDTCIEELKKFDIHTKIQYVPSLYPQGMCIAQKPDPQQTLIQPSITLYAAIPETRSIIWPQFVGKPVTEVAEFLQIHQINPEIIHQLITNHKHTCNNCIIIDQRPQAGSIFIFDEKNLPYVQLLVK